MTFVGDLHGHFADLNHWLQVVGSPSTENKLVFLGDYVDKGEFSVATVCGLLALKCLLHPANVVLLMGYVFSTYVPIKFTALYVRTESSPQRNKSSKLEAHVNTYVRLLWCDFGLTSWGFYWEFYGQRRK